MKPTLVDLPARNMHKDRREKTLHGRTLVEPESKRSSGYWNGMPQKESPRLRCRLFRRTGREPRPCNHSREHEARFDESIPTNTAPITILGSEGFQHAFVRHAEYYVDGAVHTNGIENFWMLLKRMIKGTYVSPSLTIPHVPVLG